MTRRLWCALLLSCSSESAPPACVEPESGLPTSVFCTGLYVSHDASRIAPEAMPFTPGVVLWSDGAEKHRYLYLPAGTQIDTSDPDAWRFPVGTKAWKEFRLEGKLVETRLFWKRSADAWASGTYVWDASGEATLSTAAPKGIVLESGYEIPTQKDCDRCHHGGADRLLGVEAVALSLPTAEGLTLTALTQQGRLTLPPPTMTATLPEDSTGKAGAALGYLHANCGMPCHSTRGLGDETKLVMRLRAGELWPMTPAESTESYRATVNQFPTTASVAAQFPGAQRITPGNHEASVIWQVAHRRGAYQMPPLVSHRIDEAGTRVLADWIDALPGP